MTYKNTWLVFPDHLIYAVAAFVLDVDKAVPALSEFKI